MRDAGELLDMRDGPFDEIAVPADSKDPAAAAARKRLQVVLNEHQPAPRRDRNAEHRDHSADRSFHFLTKDGRIPGQDTQKGMIMRPPGARRQTAGSSVAAMPPERRER